MPQSKNLTLENPGWFSDVRLFLIKMLPVLNVLLEFFPFPSEKEFIDLLNSIKAISLQVKWYCAENRVKEKENILVFSLLT